MSPSWFYFKIQYHFLVRRCIIPRIIILVKIIDSQSSCNLFYTGPNNLTDTSYPSCVVVHIRSTKCMCSNSNCITWWNIDLSFQTGHPFCWSLYQSLIIAIWNSIIKILVIIITTWLVSVINSAILVDCFILVKYALLVVIFFVTRWCCSRRFHFIFDVHTTGDESAIFITEGSPEFLSSYTCKSFICWNNLWRTSGFVVCSKYKIRLSWVINRINQRESSKIIKNHHKITTNQSQLEFQKWQPVFHLYKGNESHTYRLFDRSLNISILFWGLTWTKYSKVSVDEYGHALRQCSTII